MLSKLLKFIPGGNIVSGIVDLGKSFIGAKEKKERSIADWETEAIKASKGSWKDEFLTLVFASPIVLQVIGAVIFAFTGDTRLLEAADYIYNAFARVGLDYTQVMLLIIGASFGVHISRTVKDKHRVQAAKEIVKHKSNGIRPGPPDEDRR